MWAPPAASPVALASAVGGCARPRHTAWHCTAASATAVALPHGAGAHVGDCCSGRGGSGAGGVREDECGGDGRSGMVGACDLEAEAEAKAETGTETGRSRRDFAVFETERDPPCSSEAAEWGLTHQAHCAVVDSSRRGPRQVCTPTYPGALIVIHHTVLRVSLDSGAYCWNRGARPKFMACLFCRD
jgi:hypothetical protein